MNAQDENILLSVIVPVYNVERFLPRCLDSLLRQGMESVGGYEIICVNDASPDGCAAILDRYARKHPDLIRVLTHQENQGLGPARNTGVSVARGEYIGFVDSDDYVIDGGYAYICQHFLEEKPDVVRFGYRTIITDGKTIVDPEAKPNGEILFNGDGVEEYNRNGQYVVWRCFYKRDFLITHDIWSDNVVSQDTLFNFMIYQKRPHLLVTNCNLYRYEIGNEDSAQSTKQKERIIVQLNQLLFHNISIAEKYLQEGNVELAPAARRNINNWKSISHRKLLSVRLSWEEWRKYNRKIRELSIYEPAYSRKQERMLAKLKNLSVQSYLLYCIVYFMRQYVFLPFIRPLIVKNKI